MSDQPQQSLPEEQRVPPSAPEETINPESPIDQAALETFPASDPPGWAGGANVGSASHSVGAEEYERMAEEGEAPAQSGATARPDQAGSEGAEAGRS